MKLKPINENIVNEVFESANNNLEEELNIDMSMR